MKNEPRLLNAFVRFVIRLFIDVDGTELAKVPEKGPMILLFNHINSLDAPVFFSHLSHRPITAFAKAETWDNPILAYIFNKWGAISIRRNDADLAAFEKAQAALADGQLLAISPEGTRSRDGKLQAGSPGIILLALRSGSPILPVVHHGIEEFPQNIRRLKRSKFKVIVGEPFKVKVPASGLSRDVRKQITDEIMYQMAALLPADHRGVYSDLSKATQEYLEFIAPARSNLLKALPGPGKMSEPLLA